jgi:nitrile hydratase
MTRPHDMGGRFGDGPVIPEAEEVKFHADWHPRAMALTVAAGSLGAWNIDMSRHARECLAPKDYARFSYYEKWLAALADLLVQKAVATSDELAGAAPVPSPLEAKRLTAARVPQVLACGAPVARPSEMAQRFRPGDEVRTRRFAENTKIAGGHTRLPRYAAGVNGHILRFHGCHILPDASAHGLGEVSEPLYAVALPASQLWAQPEHSGDEVVLDLWQSYLEPAR